MHYFNSGFLRTYYGLGPDTNGDAIVYYCDFKKKSYLGVSTKFGFFLLISFFLLLLFLPLPAPLPSLLLHLFLPLRFPTLWGGAGFPAQKLVGFWEESEDLNRDWNQLVCHLIPEGETWAKKKALMLGLSLQPGGAGNQAPKVSQKGQSWALGIWAPQRTEDPLGRPWWECLEVVLAVVALETCPLLLLALNMPEARQPEPLAHP